MAGRTLILGVGNPMRGDDAAGPEVAEALKKAGFPNVINCRDVPEKYTKDILKVQPETVVIIDTVNLDGAPGELRVIEIDEISETGFSTHQMALKLLARYVKTHIRADVFLLGIKPESIAFEAPLSDAVRTSIDTIISFLSDRA
jgi:hydrogenase 3 maturation protease